MTKSNERKSDTLSGHTSKPYNNRGIHLLYSRVTCSEAILRILPKMYLQHGKGNFCKLQ